MNNRTRWAMGYKMDGLQTAKIYELPAYKSEMSNEVEEKRGFFFRRLVDIGVINMANAPAKPPGFYLNFSTLAVLITIFASIFGGVLFVYNATWSAAYQKGLDDAEKKSVMERLQKAEDESRRVKDLLLLENKTEKHEPEVKKK